MGLNYRDHAREANMPIPDTPVLFIKPRTALNGPAPAKINVPRIAQDGSSDYEAELSIVISKSGRDIPKEKAMEYVLGYTCSNDVSARTQQFKNSQWCFSKGECGTVLFFFFLRCSSLRLTIISVQAWTAQLRSGQFSSRLQQSMILTTFALKQY